MYQLELRKRALKDLEPIPADYKNLISTHIDIDDKTKTVIIYRVKHRREAYR